MKKSYSKFLIIPGSGCEGCISKAEKYVSDYSAIKKDIAFIFTNVKSLKILSLKLGSQTLNRENIIIDSSNYLHYRSIYPMLVEKKRKKIKSKEVKDKFFLIE
jgi:hypothetical protein